jgi:hypothetical protein
MASSIEDILMAKAIADAEDQPGYAGAIGFGGAVGTGAGMLAAPVAKNAGFRGNLRSRMAGGLVGAIMGGTLGGGIRQMAVQESPAAALLARIQAQGQLNPLDRAQLQSVLKDIYSNPGMM